MYHSRMIEETEAEGLAERILHSDSSILRLVVLDERGNLLGGAPSSHIESFRLAAGAALRNLGRAVAITQGVGYQAEQYYGDLEYLAYAFKKSKVLIFRFRPLCVIFAIILEPRASEARVLARVVRSLGSDQVAR